MSGLNTIVKIKHTNPYYKTMPVLIYIDASH